MADKGLTEITEGTVQHRETEELRKTECNRIFLCCCSVSLFALCFTVASVISVSGTSVKIGTTVNMKIRDLAVLDLRFPTSRTHAGTDAVHVDPDYSAAYVVLETDTGLHGHGLTFTIGRGTEV